LDPSTLLDGGTAFPGNAAKHPANNTASIPETRILFSVYSAYDSILKCGPICTHLLAVCEQNSSSPCFSMAHYNPLADAALQGPVVEYRGWERGRGIDLVPVAKEEQL
jgi:hypothetical protein